MVEVAKMIVIVVALICLTINSIHRRNKKAELIKEAIKNGHSIDASL